MMKISVELFTEAWLQSQCKQFASEELERPHSIGLADEGHSSLSLRLLFLQHASVTALTGHMATASHCYFILSQFWKCYFLNFLMLTEFVIFFLTCLKHLTVLKMSFVQILSSLSLLIVLSLWYMPLTWCLSK